MGFDRFAAKHAARESMRLNNPSPILVTLLYFALTSLLSAVISYLLYDPAAELMWCLEAGYTSEEILEYFLQNILQEHQRDLYLLAGVNVLLSLYSTFMSFGYTSYSLRMARNEQPGVRHLFDGFARPLRVLWADILVSLFTLLWSLLIVVPVSLLLALGGLDAANSVYIVTAVSVVTVVAVTYRYRLTSYFIIDDPDCTARMAVRRSKQAMKGWKWSLFCLDISFFGWMLLSALLSSFISYLLPVVITDVLCFWVLPYRSAAEANFYDAITGPSQPSGGFAGPDYDYHANSDGPQPF